MRNRYISNLFALLVMLSFSIRASAAEAPFLAPIANQIATIGELFTLDVDALYADPPATFELLEARPGMVINPGTGLISWTPATSSDGGKVKVRAFNSAGESIRSFLIYLSDGIVCSDDLISYWKMDETTGNTYEDFQGGYTATTLTALQDTAGKVDRAKLMTPLGKTDQYIYVNDQGQYDFTRAGGFSMSLWFKYNGQHTGTLNNQVLIARGDPTTTKDAIFMMLMINAQDFPSTKPKLTFSLRPNDDGQIKDATPNVYINVGQWYHVVAVYEGSETGTTYLRVYINDSGYSSSHVFPVVDFIGGGQYPLNIGYWDKFATNRYPFNGAIDEILIYNRALSASEVHDIYTDGLAGKPHCRPGNYFPLITSTPDETAFEDSLYSYTLTADDYDEGTLSYAAEILPDWLTFAPGTQVLSGTPTNDDVGDHTVKLMVSDGTTEVYQEFTLTVENTNDPPVFTSTAVTTATEGSAYTYLVQASDPDGDVLTYSAEVIPSWLSFDPVTKILIGIPQRDDVGDNAVSLKITDGDFEVFQDFIIAVSSNNNPPVVTSTAPTVVDNYSEYFYLMTAYDADPGDVLTYRAESVPSWLTFDPVTHILSGTPEKRDVGDHAVSLAVSDGYDETMQDFTINVRDVNTAPQVVSEPSDTAKVGQLYTYFVQVVDHESDPLAFTGTIIPGWLVFDPNSRVLSGTPAESDLGDHNVIITVSDGAFTIIHQFSIKVVPKWGVGIEPASDLISGVFPNPASDYVIFEFTGAASRVEISDLSGKVLVNMSVESGMNRVQIDLSQLESGMYMFRVFDNEMVQTGKLIIN